MSAGLGATLAGVRVLDASRVLAGPFAAQILSDLGAEVIKVEQPGSGDETRAWGPPFDGDLSSYFIACNRGKRSVALDLKKPAGRDLFMKLAAASDVVLENFRADSALSLGLSAQELHAVNPKLVVCSISGFGREGPSKDRAGYDFVVQGLSGMMASTGPVDGAPTKVGVAVADLSTAMYAVISILAGLRGRETSGHGYAIDLALLDCAVASMANVAQSHLTTGKVPLRVGNAHAQIVPYQAFEAQDSWLILAVGNDRQFQKFATVAGKSEWGSDARFATNDVRVANRDILTTLIASVIRERTVAAWTDALAAVDVPAGPVWNLQQLFRSDLAAERHLKVSARRPDGTAVELVASPLVKDLQAKMPPKLGEHTDVVLRDVLKLDAATLKKLRLDGVTA